MKEFFDRHEKVALMFSGGRDSIACLHLVEEYLDKVALVWVNTGAAFPEIVEFMEGVRKLVPNFLEVQTNQPASIKANGYPTDVVPVSFTKFGQACTTEKPIKLRSYMECCSENFWVPADKAARDLGVTAIIRGQRSSEAHRSPFKSGDTFEGVEYLFPIHHWDDEDVTKYLEIKGVVLDERLSMSHSSLDCWNCTAFCGDSTERMKYIKKNHPEKFAEVIKLLGRIDSAVTSELAGIKNMLEV